MQGSCPRCGVQLPADAAECPVCTYGDVEEIVLLEAQPPGAPRSEPDDASPVPRVLAGLAILVLVIAVIFAAVR